MIDEATLREHVQRKEDERMRKRERRALRLAAWYAGICPDCGGENVVHTNTFLSNVPRKFKCLNCGARHRVCLDD